uniref:Protein phosphatase 1 regulatory subunit 36 n=1 Tax=Knipowitschia caucasica TaxID=637954 RepID=A0AAV2K0W7_KNICA
MFKSSLLPPEKPAVRKRRPTDVHFEEILQKSEWLAEVYRANSRGRQSVVKSLDPSLLKAYRSAVIQNQGEFVTIDDVKQVAVDLLLENYSLPIPHSFLDLLKSKEFDEVLMALLCYLCCFFEHRSLDNKSDIIIVLDLVAELRMKRRSSAKTALALKQLAVCYFSLILDAGTHHKQHKGRSHLDQTEWLLEGVLYSFFCYVSWVTFGRKDLKHIQDEIGRILYSDNFSAAVNCREDVHSRRSSAVSTPAQATPTETTPTDTTKLRRSRFSVRRVVNGRSPLMMSLLPLPREQSPLLLRGRRDDPEPLFVTPADDVDKLREELSRMSVGILGRPLQQLDGVTLIHKDHIHGASVTAGQSDH